MGGTGAPRPEAWPWAGGRAGGAGNSGRNAGLALRARGSLGSAGSREAQGRLLGWWSRSRGWKGYPRPPGPVTWLIAAV